MPRLMPVARSLTLIAVLSLSSVVAHAADSVADFYKGKSVTMIVGYTPGSTYDVWARFVGRHVGKHIPGNPTVVVQNMPGAGSMTASNHIYNIAPQDGTIMGLMSATNPVTPLLGMDQAKFDAKKFTWLGTPTVDTAVVMVWNTAPVNTIQDAMKTEVILGSTSPNGTSSFYARIFNDILKTKFKLVYGFPGMNESFLAIERGEVQGHSSPFWSFMKSNKADWIRDKKVKFLLQYGSKRNPDLPDVPFARDLIKSEEDLKLFDASMAPLYLGYPFLAGPGVPADRAAALKKAYEETFKDPEFIAEAKKLNLDLYPENAAYLDKVIKDAYDTPQPIIDRMRKLYEGDAALAK